MAVVRAAVLVVPMLVVGLLRQAARQRTAAAVAKRARQRAIAEGDDTDLPPSAVPDFKLGIHPQRDQPCAVAEA
jgi:hypothetical protein